MAGWLVIWLRELIEISRAENMKEQAIHRHPIASESAKKATREQDNILTIKGARVRYGDNYVLDGVDLTVRRGQLASLIGPNGAGKSTLLKAIVGLLPTDAGTIDCRARRLGFVPQQAEIESDLPVTVGEFLAMKRINGRKVEKKALIGTLEEIGASHLIRRKLGELSGGEFQRVMIAYALMGDPDFLLLDEPLTGVDFRGGMTFHRLLHHLHEERALTVLMVSHDMHLVEHMSEVIFCLNRIVCCHGSPEDVLTKENLEHAYSHGLDVTPGSDL